MSFRLVFAGFRSFWLVAGFSKYGPEVYIALSCALKATDIFVYMIYIVQELLHYSPLTVLIDIMFCCVIIHVNLKMIAFFNDQLF